MDFDEYEYLEKTVESQLPKDANGKTEGTRRSERSRSRDRDKEKSRDRDRETSRDREREKSRDREREKSKDRHRHRGRNYDGEHHRDREYYDREMRRSRGSDGERDRERSRSRDHRSHSRSRDRDWYRDRDREREGSRLRDRGRSYSEEREYRHSRETREKKEPAAEPEADPERDQRTVFAYQISLKADERDVYEFFSRAGKVRDVRLIMDRNARRSKGVGYIEFYDVMSVPMAIALTGQLLLGQPVMVKPSEAEKNLVPSTSSASFMGPYSGGARRLYVGNLHPSITESQLRQVFEPFGTVELVQLPLDSDTGLCKGFGFVQFVKLEDARAAQMALNGVLELGGRVIKVLINSDQNPQDGVAPGEFDDDDGGGLSLTAESRALLMQKLDRSGITSSVAGAVTKPVGVLPTQPIIAPLMPGVGLLGMGAMTAGAIEAIGTPTDCLLLKNMFDPRTETEPDFDLDIKDEVQSECSKFGVVKHIFVDKYSAGHVYLRFHSTTAAMAAQHGLHGRWFAGKMISATYLTSQVYEGKFPESK